MKIDYIFTSENHPGVEIRITAINQEDALDRLDNLVDVDFSDDFQLTSID